MSYARKKVDNMATAAVSRKKNLNSRLRNFVRDLSNEIDAKARHLSEAERKKRHAKLLEIANRGPK